MHHHCESDDLVDVFMVLMDMLQVFNIVPDDNDDDDDDANNADDDVFRFASSIASAE